MSKIECAQQLKVGEFALLTVVARDSAGAFLKGGLNKDLFLPFSEQTEELYEGKEIIVFLFLDNQNRSTASMRLEKYLSSSPPKYQQEQSVNLLIYSETNLGYKALINGQHHGVLYHNEVFRPLHYGQFLPGYIKKIREDGKIDLGISKIKPLSSLISRYLSRRPQIQRHCLDSRHVRSRRGLGSVTKIRCTRGIGLGTTDPMLGHAV